LDQHIISIGDKAEIPEAQMIEQMWPSGIQPKTDQPLVTIKDKTIRISCPTPGASIGYILSDKQMTPDLDSGWQLYHQSIKTNEAKYLYVLANRIGFADSEIVENRIYEQQ
jgi:N-sulfoglucosamine sulfohydrolase